MTIATEDRLVQFAQQSILTKIEKIAEDLERMANQLRRLVEHPDVSHRTGQVDYLSTIYTAMHHLNWGIANLNQADLVMKYRDLKEFIDSLPQDA